ncbi:MAG TPA: BBP7 family outer membrane beta-barrel protein [Gemmataceae bacterium]|nr:BBP7 family outer membrane beta-barrel protein [Gemmataceae bacterium]
MRKGMLGSIAALAAGAGSAWAQAPLPVAPAGGPPASAVRTLAANEPVGVTTISGLDGGGGPSPVIMPPISAGPPGDPHGLGPVGGFGPPPGPMYPMPGPYTQPLWQPAGPGGPGGAGGGGAMGGAPKFWMNSEYLLWFPASMPLRYPLVTTSAPSDRGLLGRPSTLVLVGQNDLSYDATSGARFTMGFFGDADRRFGAELSGFFMAEKHNESFFLSSPTGIPTLARPFIDSADPRGSTTLVIANPNFAQGSIAVDASTTTYSVEGSAVINLFRSAPGGGAGGDDCGPGGRIFGSGFQCSLDFLMGYRFLELAENLTIESRSNLNIPPTITPQFVVGPNGTLTQVGSIITPIPVPFGGVNITSPSLVTVRDQFRTTNRFNGGQVGLRAEVRRGMFTLATTGKLGIGHMHQVVELHGNSAFVGGADGRNGGAFGGLYNNAANIGKYNNDEFVVMPEFTGNLGVQVTRAVNCYVGYNFLYMNKVVRPGSQLNPVVNSATVPFSTNYGALGRPSVPLRIFDQDDFWLMGINFGLQIRF